MCVCAFRGVNKTVKNLSLSLEREREIGISPIVVSTNARAGRFLTETRKETNNPATSRR